MLHQVSVSNVSWVDKTKTDIANVKAHVDISMAGLAYIHLNCSIGIKHGYNLFTDSG